MKSRFVFLLQVFTVCILSGCGAGHNARMDVDFSASDAAQTAESGAVVVAEDGASTLHMLGAANKYGWYQVGYDETDVWYGTVIDFAEAEEREISAPDSLPMNGRVGNLQVDDAQIVWSWSGMLTDTPALVVTDFDRNQTGAVSFPQGWYLAGWAPIAADEQYLYAKGGMVSDDPARLDERRLRGIEGLPGRRRVELGQQLSLLHALPFVRVGAREGSGDGEAQGGRGLLLDRADVERGVDVRRRGDDDGAHPQRIGRMGLFR